MTRTWIHLFVVVLWGMSGFLLIEVIRGFTSGDEQGAGATLASLCPILAMAIGIPLVLVTEKNK